MPLQSGLRDLLSKHCFVKKFPFHQQSGDLLIENVSKISEAP